MKRSIAIGIFIVVAIVAIALIYFIFYGGSQKITTAIVAPQVLGTKIPSTQKIVEMDVDYCKNINDNVNRFTCYNVFYCLDSTKPDFQCDSEKYSNFLSAGGEDIKKICTAIKTKDPSSCSGLSEPTLSYCKNIENVDSNVFQNATDGQGFYLKNVLIMVDAVRQKNPDLCSNIQNSSAANMNIVMESNFTIDKNEYYVEVCRKRASGI